MVDKRFLKFPKSLWNIGSIETYCMIFNQKFCYCKCWWIKFRTFTKQLICCFRLSQFNFRRMQFYINNVLTVTYFQSCWEIEFYLIAANNFEVLIEIVLNGTCNCPTNCRFLCAFLCIVLQCDLNFIAKVWKMELHKL